MEMIHSKNTQVRKGFSAYAERKAKITGNLAEYKQQEIDFCTINCPHKNKPCKRTCEEFKVFIKELRNKYKIY